MRPYISLEYCSKKDLFDYVYYGGPFSDNANRFLFKQLLDGVFAIHDLGFAHRDLKPENILFDGNFTLKITDFLFTVYFLNPNA